MALINFANKKIWDPSLGTHSSAAIFAGSSMYKALDATNNAFALDGKIIIIMDATKTGAQFNCINPSNYTPHVIGAAIKVYKVSDNSIIPGTWTNELWTTNGSSHGIVAYNAVSIPYATAGVCVLTFTPSAYLAYSTAYKIEIDDLLDSYTTV